MKKSTRGRWSVEVLEAIARINTRCADLDIEPITLTEPKKVCRYNDCERPARKQSEFCSKEHYDGHPWTIWDPVEYSPADGGTDRQCTNPHTVVRPVVRPFPPIKAPHARNPRRGAVLLSRLNEGQCKYVGLGVRDGRLQHGRWLLNEDRMPQCAELDWSWHDEQHVPTTAEWFNAVTDNPEDHPNDRWPDFEVCSKCLPVIPWFDVRLLSQDARERLRADERADEPFRTEVGDRVADYVPPRPKRVHTSSRHAIGITPSTYRGAIREAAKDPDAPKEIVTLTVGPLPVSVGRAHGITQASLEEEQYEAKYGVYRERFTVNGVRDRTLSVEELAREGYEVRQSMKDGREDEQKVRTGEGGYEVVQVGDDGYAVEHTDDSVLNATATTRTETDDALESGMAAVLDRLTANQQDALRRRYWERRSFQEAADDLGIHKSTFQKRQDQAVAALRHLLQQLPEEVAV